MSDLHATLYERRFPAGRDGNFLVNQLRQRFEGTRLRDLVDDTGNQTLRLKSSRVVESTGRWQFTAARTKRELAFLLEGEDAWRLSAEADKLEAIDASAAQRRYLDIEGPDGGPIDTALLVPFMNLSRWTGNLALVNLMQEIDKNCLGAEAIPFNILPAERILAEREG